MAIVEQSKAIGAAAPPVYDDLGVRTFINAAGTYTRLGGSRMPPTVVEAMATAARSFVEIDELQTRVGSRIAALTHNEAAYVSCGAAAGLVIATAACIAGTDPARARQLPDLRGLRNQVVMHRAHRNPYDYAVRMLPIELVEIGFPNAILPTQVWELDHVLGDQTAAVVYVETAWLPPGALPLSAVIAIAHQRGVPVIVDAAAQLPPKENLWRYTQLGADLVVFSGGKDLRGPQSSGLVVGRSDLIDACFLVGAPHHGFGRPFKVGKEEMIGLLAAVEWYMQQDEEERLRQTEGLVARMIERLSGSRAQVQRIFPNEAGQPLPRALVRFTGPDAAADRDRFVCLLREGRPSVEVGLAGADGCFVDTSTVDRWEDETLVGCLRTAMDAL